MYKREDGRWRECIILPGMTKPKYFYGKTQKEVKQKIAAWQGKQQQRETFVAVSNAWAADHAERVSYNASEAYRAPLKAAQAHFEGRDVSSITPAEIDAYIKAQAAKGYAKRTVQNRLDMFHMIFDYAILHGFITANPCAAVRMPSGLQKTGRELPTEEQVEKVKAGRALPFGLFAYTLLYTGMRPGELLGLRIEDIDKKAGVIHVQRAVYFEPNTAKIKEPKTEAGKRDVLLLDPLRDVLPDVGKGYLFGGDKPLTKSSYRKRWLAWCRAAGLAHKDGDTWVYELVAYQLRHAYATMLYDAGIEDQDAMELMGHSSIQVTRNVYTHIKQSRKQVTAEKLNKFISGDLGQNVVKFG